MAAEPGQKPTLANGTTTRPSFLINAVTDPSGPAFALIRRPAAHQSGTVDILIGDVTQAQRLADLPHHRTPGPPPRHDLLVVVPYRQLRERGLACHDDQSPLLALSVRQQSTATTDDLLDALPDDPVLLRDTAFDLNDDEYADVVRRVLDEEIASGEGANFVIRRSVRAHIDNFDRRAALALFRRLLTAETAAYWTFLVYTDSHVLLGASPEQHVGLAGGVVSMNPISGTLRYPPSGGVDVDQVLRFLADGKETDELAMVLDEELKMMAGICADGGQVQGPYLRELSSLAHTEYRLTGTTARDVRTLLHETMFAPTVTGSPLENACRVIHRHESSGRGYYSGVLALVGRDAGGEPTVDSAILIRSAEISPDGRLEIGAGATLVRHSDPYAEAAETRAKVATMLSVFGDGPPRAAGTSGQLGLAGHAAVRTALASRNDRLARFWFTPFDRRYQPDQALTGRRALLVDAEDAFTAMLAHQLTALGVTVDLIRYDRLDSHGLSGDPRVWSRHDVMVLGPGPGDPRHDGNGRIAGLRRIAQATVQSGFPVVAVCLGHQILAGVLGLPVAPLPRPNQGVAREIDLFGRRVRAGFYNSFAAWATQDQQPGPGPRGLIDISRDRRTGEVYGLKARHLRSVQFHPESVLTVDGPDLVRELLLGALRDPRVPVGSPVGRPGPVSRPAFPNNHGFPARTSDQ